MIMMFVYYSVSKCIAAIYIEQHSLFDFYWYNQTIKSGRFVHIYIFY